MDDLAKLIDALRQLYVTLGPTATFVLLASLTGVVLLVTMLRDRALQKAQQQAIDAKEQQIERVADENRIYRNLFFKKFANLNDDEIAALMGDPKGAKSLSGTETKQELRDRRGA